MPQNWSYVGSWASVVLVVVTILPEVVYPYFYIKTHRKMLQGAKQKNA